MKKRFGIRGVSASLLFVLFLLAATVVNAQQRTITGTVTDSRNLPLPGVTVMVEGTTQGTVTNGNGVYSIDVPANAEVLIFSFVGMTTLEEQISGRTSINVQLQEDVIGLEEVVAVGYGVQRRSDVTGSVGVVGADELLERPSFNALQGMRGRVAGVNIFSNSGSPTGSTRVVIRGVNSIGTSSNPLYVVDGVVMENFHLVNPNDIERIEVLKDASATAIYGA